MESLAIDYPLKNKFVMGIECSGTVIEYGGGLQGWFLMGKRVAFTKLQENIDKLNHISIGGTYSQYAITNAYQ